MAGSRTLKLSILADVDDLNKKLKAANTDVETSADKIAKFGKAAAAGFAIAGAAAVKFGIDFAKAAAIVFKACPEAIESPAFESLPTALST